VVARNSPLLANRRFYSFIHPKTKMKIDLKGFTLHVATRKTIQTGPRLDFSLLPTPRKKFDDPLRNTPTSRWRSFFNKYQNLKKIGC
jgi:hypothetical protein